jgi:3-methyladenine DNA glycosylase AlkD
MTIQKTAPATSARVIDILHWLERRGTARNRDGMARDGIRSPKAFGVGVAPWRQLARRVGRDHELALALWKTGWLEARLLTVFTDDPAVVTASGSAARDREAPRLGPEEENSWHSWFCSGASTSAVIEPSDPRGSPSDCSTSMPSTSARRAPS